jgi:hypothetical protein
MVLVLRRQQVKGLAVAVVLAQASAATAQVASSM